MFPMRVLPRPAAELAAANHGFVSRAELLEQAGLTKSQIDKLVNAGALIVDSRGNYRVPGAPVTRRQQLLAATRRAAAPAADESTLGLHHAQGFDLVPPFTVAVPPSRRLRTGDLRFVQVVLREEDVETYEGIPSMTVERACINLAARARLARMRVAMHDLRRRGELDVRLLRRRLTALWGDPGARQMREWLDSGALLHESNAEARLDRIWRPGDPRPTPQVWVFAEGRYYRLDFAFLDSRLAPEYDGEAAHGGEANRHRDAQRTLALAAIDVERLAITAPMLRDPAGLREQILAVHRRRLGLGLAPLVPVAAPPWWNGV